MLGFTRKINKVGLDYPKHTYLLFDLKSKVLLCVKYIEIARRCPLDFQTEGSRFETR